MSIYYQRESGPEGQIISGDGDAQGVDLATLIESGSLPVRVALEVVAYVADIVTVAEEDKLVHGDLSASDVKIDPYGTVSVEGYGVTRRGGRAPEGKPVGVATDVYGMGALLVSALSGESLGAVPRDRDGHDEVIVQRLLAIDWKHLQGKRWMEDLLRFLSAMFSFAPEERPAPLDVANVLSHVAGQAGGDDIATWAVRAVRAAGGTQGRVSTGTVLPQEDLGGPQSLGAPMSSTQALRVRGQAASAKGQSTAMWSRDRIAEMLAEEDEEELKKPIRKEWRPDDTSRPRPRGDDSRPIQRPLNASLPPRDPGPPPSAQKPALTSLPPPPARDQRPVPPPPMADAPRPVPPPPPPKQNTPPASPFAIQGPIASQPIDPPSDEAPKSGALKYVIIGVLVLSVLCLGGGGVGYMLWTKFGPGATSATTVTTPEVPTPDVTTPTPKVEEEPVDTGKTPSAQGADADGDDPPKTTEPPPATTTKTTPPATTTTAPATTTKTTSASSGTAGSTKSTSSSGTKSTTKSSTKTTTTSTPKTTTTTTTAARGPYTVKIVARDLETTLQCGDGQQSTFVGSTRMTFSDVTTCRVKMGAALGVVQINATATFTCSADASNRVTCSQS